LFGMGGAMLQKLDRDTQKFAFKCSYAEINGRGIDVEKHPVELDHHGSLVKSFKQSKAGRLKLICTKKGYTTAREEEFPEHKNELVSVFENGKIIREYDFEEIRNRVASFRREEFCLD